MKKREFSEELKKTIDADYSDTNNKVTDIMEAYSLSSYTLKRILAEQGVELRQPQKGVRYNKTKKCPKCRRKVELKGAKFCPYCGADIRSEKELLFEKVNKLFGMLMLLPASSRDEAQAIIREVSQYISKN